MMDTKPKGGFDHSSMATAAAKVSTAKPKKPRTFSVKGQDITVGPGETLPEALCKHLGLPLGSTYEDIK